MLGILELRHSNLKIYGFKLLRFGDLKILRLNILRFYVRMILRFFVTLQNMMCLARHKQCGSKVDTADF